MQDIDKNTVKMILNFDDTEYEPTVLPARFPNLLVNGSTGISSGYATEIPPHNLTEVIDATIYLLKHPDATLDDLMQYVKGPDFPTGAIVMGTKGIKEAYETGRGRIQVRSKTSIQEIRGHRKEIVITEIDRNAKTATITVKKGVKWSDGEQVNAKDIEYSYEILANKKTASQRYNSQFEDILGMKEYHDGKAKTISGIEMPQGEKGRTVVIHFKELKPGMYYSGNGYFWESAAPYHYLKNVPFNKLQSSNQIRQKPLYFGPFKVQKIVRGQSVTWVPNKYYWRGRPKLNKIVIQVVSPNSASQSIKSHKFDIAAVRNSQWDRSAGVTPTTEKI